MPPRRSNKSADPLCAEPEPSKKVKVEEFSFEGVQIIPDVDLVSESDLLVEIPTTKGKQEKKERRKEYSDTESDVSEKVSVKKEEDKNKIKPKRQTRYETRKKYSDNESDVHEEVPTKKEDDGNEVKKPRFKNRAKHYVRYEKEELLEAVNMVKKKKMSVTEAGRYYNIPKSTLLTYVKNSDREPAKRGVASFITPEEDQQLLSWLAAGSDLGDPRSRYDLIQAAAEVVKLNDRSHTFKNGVPAPSVIQRFVKKYKSSVKLRIGNESVNEVKFFYKFHEYLEKNNLLDVLKRPDAFYFIEETSFELDPQKITSERRMMLKKYLLKRLDTSEIRLKESVTVTYGFGGDGKVLQQLLIFRDSFDDMIKVALADRELNAKFLFTKTHDGGNTKDTFRCYLERIETQLSNVKRPIFIFCHETFPRIGVDLQRWCKVKQIHVISFIPSAVSVLNTINEDVFGLNNTGWIDELNSFMQENDKSTISEVDFIHIVKNLNDAVMSKEKICSAFAQAGIYPFDMTRVKDSISEDEFEDDDYNQRKTTIEEKIESLRSMCAELTRHLKNKQRRELLQHVKIITQQLDIIESSL